MIELNELNKALRQKKYTDRYTRSESTNENGVFDYEKASCAYDKRMNFKEKEDLKKHINEMITWHKENKTDYSHYLQMKIYYKLV